MGQANAVGPTSIKDSLFSSIRMKYVTQTFQICLKSVQHSVHHHTTTTAQWTVTEMHCHEAAVSAEVH